MKILLDVLKVINLVLTAVIMTMLIAASMIIGHALATFGDDVPETPPAAWSADASG